MASSWVERISSFLRSPSRFLCCTTAELFLAELLREQRDDRVTYDVKVHIVIIIISSPWHLCPIPNLLIMLSPLCEYPTLLCPTASAGEETALELMSVFSHCPAKHTDLRCQLLITLTTVLVSTSCVSTHSHASRDLLDLLLPLVQDTYYDPHADALSSIRATACECLRELEACFPGLLSQHLELLNGLRQQDNSRHHQALSGLYTLVLRNAVHLLSWQTGAGAESLKALLGGNASVAWEADPDSVTLKNRDAPLPSVLVPIGAAPMLQTGPECKELRSILSSLLEESYLLTPLSQAALLHGLIEIVVMVSGVSPAIFKAQLLRLLGTSKLCLFHSTLLMKAAFTDSLFSVEDEAFVLKRLVALCQHPLLTTADKLFYTDCLLHFPENRPIGGADGEETLPVLLTPRLATALVPTVFNDTASMLARLNLASLVYLEEEEEHGEEENVIGGGGGGLLYLYDHLKLLLHIVERGGGREWVVTFFRVAFLFLCHFSHVERYADDLRRRLCGLYLQHARLAPHILNLADRAQDGPVEPGWAVALLRAQVVTAGVPLSGLSLPDLRWHLRVLARVAEEGQINQGSTLDFLFAITSSTSTAPWSGDWRLGSDTLAVCRHLLAHPSLDALLCPLADVLQHTALHHGDTDIRDHARLQYMLLTTLSREKLGGVLCARGAKEGRQDKKRSLSSIMVDSQDLTNALTIHHADTAVFQLVAQNHWGGPRRFSELTRTREEDSAGTGPGGPDTDVLSSYRSQLHGSSAASQISLSYELSHTDAHHPGRFDQLFSIRLHFEPTDGHYAELDDICVPCLFRERTTAPLVTLTLSPRAPYPTTLRCSAIFTTQDELTWHLALPDVRVAFHQLFKPLPVPASWGPSLQLRVFEELWDEFCSGEESVGEGGNPSPDRDSSLFCSQLGEAELVALVERHFAPYHVVDPCDAVGHKVLLFLPPRSHMLLKITPEEDAVQFNMATDNWRLLPHVNSFLRTITDWEGQNGVGSELTVL
ncbi:AP-5 complex subunit beta-1 [Merluccius polli]|uniref:AP-5 complex subunit beta-1 n=1 Tax=Merluccius polli TaxID=89951 RepID=A0AA47M1K3_MERPO|nr:AP-5 complex subunit beta-1 [Merluccius polli]